MSRPYSRFAELALTFLSDLPFSGIEVSQAAFTFIYRFMGNKSEEYPAGVLNKEVLKSFMSIHGPEDNLRWVPGNERIPEVSISSADMTDVR